MIFSVLIYKFNVNTIKIIVHVIKYIKSDKKNQNDRFCQLYSTGQKHHFLILMVFVNDDLPYLTLILYFPTLSFNFSLRAAIPFLLVLAL